MRYFYEPPEMDIPIFGETYWCDHPLYHKCTLFLHEGLGLAVVQQRLDENKQLSWGPIDFWLANDIYKSEGFPDYFEEHAAMADENRLYPTVSVRKIMWALRMKPLKREFWETILKEW